MQAAAEPVQPSADAGDLLSRTLDIKRRLQRNPYGMLAGALGIGFVLGGGLFTRLSGRVLGAGLRVGLMAAMPIIAKQLTQALGGSKAETPKENDR
jgi:hypothetical protein